MESLNVQGRTFNDVDAWESGDLVPDLSVEGGIDDHYVLLVALQILGSEREDEVVDGAVEATDDDMIGELDVFVDYLGICLALRLHQDIIITLKGIRVVLLGCLFSILCSSFFGLFSLALQNNLYGYILLNWL